MFYHPDTNGIVWNGLHSCTDLDATCINRSTPPPKPVKRQERVAYSNVTLDFSMLSGVKEYENRTLQYTFGLSDPNPAHCREKYDAFVEWLTEPNGFQELWDSREPLYHYMAKLASIDVKTENEVYFEIKVTFEAYPFRVPNEDAAYPVDEQYFPDIDGDGYVTAADAQMIQTAAANIGAGEPSGLNEDQSRRADADRDGRITAVDAQIVLEFASLVGAGDYANTPAGWTAYLNAVLCRRYEVI